MTRSRLATFTWAYVLGFTAYSVGQGTRRVVAYLLVVGILAFVVRRVHRAHPLPPVVLWALSICGALHMAGGLLPSPSAGAPIFYETWLIEPVLKYDQFVHFATSAVVVLACWELLGHLLGPRATPLARGLIAALMALGFGAGNEAFEFLSAQRFADAFVGNLQNTGWDLVFNTCGALTALVWLVTAAAPVASSPSIPAHESRVSLA
ncbi:MAG TPA: DUF2238 domain-containing protein [Acidimicrobiales bacterium]|nr:DUF2238 domain-containing protein [Acidimicrobiales bacterium]